MSVMTVAFALKNESYDAFSTDWRVTWSVPYLDYEA